MIDILTQIQRLRQGHFPSDIEIIEMEVETLISYRAKYYRLRRLINEKFIPCQNLSS